ncbi:MAG: hypothetical protein RIC82_09675, partial [Parvibaculum sp.]
VSSGQIRQQRNSFGILWTERVDGLADGCPEISLGSGGGLFQKAFQLREGRLDRITLPAVAA